MEYRELGRTGWKVSALSFGAWAIGGAWGATVESESLAALHRAVEMGVNFFDTADVYGDGISERLLARLRRETHEKLIIATKAGRRLHPHTAAGYNRENLTAFVERSLENLETDALDLLQLHCPPTPVYYLPEVFGILDDLVQAGKIRYYGVSVEKVEEALKAIEFPNVQSVQIIFNMFRQRPADLLFEQVKKRRVGILARVPLASGLLTGKMKPDSTFAVDDHRAYNRLGESFDRGVPAGVNIDVAGMPEWGPSEGFTHRAFTATGYTIDERGRFLLQSRNSWGGVNPPVAEDRFCRISRILQVLGPAE